MAKHIAITGVSRGLGRALCDQMIQLGHTISGCARNAPDIAVLGTRYGNAHRFSVVDVSEVDQVEIWCRETVDEVGVPDLVLNNAGVINANADLWDVPVEQFRLACNVNLLGPYLVIRGFLPAMLCQGKGGIVNFSSTWGQTTAPHVAPYCATKWAIEGMTRALSEELPAGLFAVAFNPGVINTDMLQTCFGGGADGYPRPEEWARRAAPVLLALGPHDNGKSVRAPS